MTNANLLVFLAIIFYGQTSGHFVEKCCPEGELLESVPENGGDIFVKENPKGEAAKKMFDGEMCSLQVFLKENCDIF